MTTATEDWADSMVAAAEPPTVEVKLFGKWNPDEIHVNDISLAVSGFTELCVSEGDKLTAFSWSTGLHICEGEGSKVLASHGWSLCRQAIQEGTGMPSKLCVLQPED